MSNICNHDTNMEHQFIKNVQSQHAVEIATIKAILNVETYGGEIRKDVLRRIRTDLVLTNFNSCQAQIILGISSKNTLMRRNVLNCQSRRPYVSQLEKLTYYLKQADKNEINIYHCLRVCATYTTKSYDNRNS